MKNIIEPTILNNSNSTDFGLIPSETKDFVFLDSYQDTLAMSNTERAIYPTDFAIMNNAILGEGINPLGKKCGSCSTWLRSKDNEKTVITLRFDSLFVPLETSKNNIALCPSMHLNLSSVISSKNTFKISEIKPKKGENYHTLEFGEYPKSYVGNKQNDELRKLYASKDINLIPTGKEYTGRIYSYDEFTSFPEFEYNGQKYVRLSSQNFDYNYIYSDGTRVTKLCNNIWVKVEPIIWRIRNWDDLPKEINPNGSGKAQFINVKTEEAIMSGIPFYPNNFDTNRSLWQNSMIRAFLNGYDIKEELLKGNGDPNLSAPEELNFVGKNNFLAEAFNITTQNKKLAKFSEKKEIKNNSRKTKSKGYGVIIQETPLNIDEQIKFYINQGKSFMLHGASGVGKSRRIKDIDPDFTSIVLRNGMLPEEVLGKNIYPSLDKTTTGVWVPPSWYTSLCEKCNREPDKNHVLFIDEITNVKGTTQSLAYDLILNRSIGPNLGKLPNNAVVVSAGNSKDESEAAYNMPEPLFRRFDAHIYLPINIENWLEWGSQPAKNNPDRLTIHPLVSAFVATYGENVFYSEYNPEEPSKYAIDPRGWEQISDIIYDNNGIIVNEFIENKVGKEIATNFMAFAKKPPLLMEDILTDNYDDEEIPKIFDAQYALALSLRKADFSQIEKVRNFISEKLDEEILSMFDSIWVGNDDEKAIALEQIKPKEKTEVEKIDKNCKILLKNFFKGKNAVFAKTIEEAKMFIEATKNLSKGEVEFSIPDDSSFKKGIYYTSDGNYASISKSVENYTIYNIDEVDMKEYLPENFNAENEYKITLDEFVNSNNFLGIHCADMNQLRQLLTLLEKAGISIPNKNEIPKFFVRNFPNDLCCSNKPNTLLKPSRYFTDNSYGLFEFDEVNMKKYLDKSKDSNKIME